MWSPEDPYLYHTTIEAEGDVVPITYGIRTIEYSAEKGLQLNGKPIVLNGGCVHHDNGILGASAFDAAEYRRVRLLKDAGFNAVRTSHNPPSEAFLRACDELGLLVIDEAFDGWRDKKNDFDYSTLIDQWWQEDIKAMVLRDRNHPCVFCWSIGNEVIERKKIEVVKTAHQLASLCRQLDEQHRPITSALCSWDNDWDIYDPLAAEHDIVGYNYMIHKSQGDHERVSNRVMVQTESYPRDAWQSYRKVMDEPYIIGEKEVVQGMATFTLPYQPGTLRAEGGEETVSLQTADEVKAIRLTADRTTLKADGQDLAFITIELTDGNGIVNCTSNNELTVSVSGPITLIGFGNADIKDCDRSTDSTHRAWKGRALLVVRSTGKKGKATITVQGKGLKTASINLSL